MGVHQRPGAGRHAGRLDVQGRLLRKARSHAFGEEEESALAQLRPVCPRGSKIETGQSCILRDVPNSGDEAAKFRCAMYARKELILGRYSYRAVPGGMRVTGEAKAK